MRSAISSCSAPCTPEPLQSGHPCLLAGWIRGHWGIEALHHIREVTCGEDASQIRAGNGPQVMATLRNLPFAILKPGGHASIAAAANTPATPPAPCPRPDSLLHNQTDIAPLCRALPRAPRPGLVDACRCRAAKQ